jgi:hypothetical protein
VTRLREKQRSARENLDAVLDSTPLATVAFVRDGHPVALPIGFARLGDELVIHGSTGSPWLRHLADGALASVAVTQLDGVVLARSGFESSFHYRSAVLFGRFEGDNWSVKIGDGWPEDDAADVAAGGWAGVVPMVTTYGSPLRAPDCDESVPGVVVVAWLALYVGAHTFTDVIGGMFLGGGIVALCGAVYGWPRPCVRPTLN